MLTRWQEFDNLKDNEVIYKLVGPVLLKQEKFEADSTVKGRLEFIGGELYVLPHSLHPIALLQPLPSCPSLSDMLSTNPALSLTSLTTSNPRRSTLPPRGENEC